MKKHSLIKKVILLLVCILIINLAGSHYIVIPSSKFVKGIDISEHQGEIDWANLDYNEISFVFIRSSYGITTDDYFFSNYEHARKSNLQVGIYHYLYATSIEGAIEEANYLCNLIENYEFDLPIYLDVEDPTLDNLDETTITNIILAFLNVLEEKNYEVGYYTNISFYLRNLSGNGLSHYPKWIAQYSDILINIPSADYWQYTNTGRISGISTDVDFSYMIK